MEYVVFVGAVVVIMLIISIVGNIDNHKKRKQYEVYLKKQYGTFAEKEMTPEHMTCVRTYYERHRDKSYRAQDDSMKTEEVFQIDDITWNDLEMDHLFQQMNCMESSAGEEYLYYTLRTPGFQGEQFEELENLIHYFDTREDERVQFQYLCKELGKTGKYSLYDYLDYLNNLGKRSNVIHYVADLLFIPAFIATFFNIGIGLVSLFILICFNMVTYFREKDEIAPYITSFLYIMRILQFTGKIQKAGLKPLEPYTSELLRSRSQFRKFSSHASLVVSDMSSSGNPLEIIMDYLKMIFHIDLIKFNSMLGELQHHEKDVDHMVTTIGYLETAIAVGNYRRALTGYCIPTFTGHMGMRCDDIYHPYIKDPVKNSIDTQKSVLLTGSNASGKSTFLKTIALNAITAQTIHTVAASYYESCFYRIYSSMSLRDSLSTGESYYMVEIRAIKRILEGVKESQYPVLCFVDEVLRGTNTVERIAASTQILMHMDENAMCFAATHDVELTTLLEQQYNNYHFTEDVVDGDVLFNYELRKGAATTRNAIKLLQSIGYDESIIKEANAQAEHFMRTGSWEA